MGVQKVEQNRLRRALIFGAGEGGEQIARSVQSAQTAEWQIVGFLDDDPVKLGTSVSGIDVVGARSDLAEIAQAEAIDVLIIAAPGHPDLTSDLARYARRFGLAVKIVPPLEELLRDWVDVRDIRELSFDDLLGRRHVEIDLEIARQSVQGQTILVTGAGGSIGRELCQQLMSMGPALLLMLDRDESALHGTSLALGMGGKLNRREFVLADIRDARRIDQIFEQEQPDVVFHAAALKHVQSLERHPGEAIQTNVGGGLNVLRASAAVGVNRFVNISSDKAADPVNVLGRSKRIAEGLTSWFGQKYPGEFVSVRFGNVLGSRGSVLETFRSQLAKGQPLTVSDPDVTRFLMAIREAVALVIHAAATGSSGQALVLDMGEPIRIMDIAEHLIAAAGGNGTITFSGLAEGEKLHEVLLSAGETGSSPFHPLVTHVDVPSLDPELCLELDPYVSSEVAHQRLADLVKIISPAVS